MKPGIQGGLQGDEGPGLSPRALGAMEGKPATAIRYKLALPQPLSRLHGGLMGISGLRTPPP